MPSAASARRSVTRTTIWLLSFISAYVLVGTWAFTPELARASIAREVSATAVPRRTLTTRKPAVLRASGDARGTDTSHERRPPSSTFCHRAPARSPRAIGATRRNASATGAATARNRNRVLYEATPPPVAA